MGEREVRQARAQERGWGFVDLDRVRPDRAARDSIPAELARELRALPIRRDGTTLWVVSDEPDAEAMRRIAGVTGLRVVPVACVPADLDVALANLD